MGYPCAYDRMLRIYGVGCQRMHVGDLANAVEGLT